jgi:hypothetical protein
LNRIVTHKKDLRKLQVIAVNVVFQKWTQKPSAERTYAELALLVDSEAQEACVAHRVL